MSRTFLPSKGLQCAASAIFIGAAAFSSVEAATQTWSGTNSGVWDVSALNWDSGAAAWTSSNDALFSGTPTNNVTTATGLTIATITLDNTFTGSVTLTGANTVSGATTINGGTLNLNAATGLGASAITVNSGGTLAINPGTGNNTVANNISGAGLVTAQDPAGAGGNTLQLGGDYSGFTGTLNILAGASSFGKVNFSNTNQASVMSSSATIQVRNGATLYLNKGLNYGASIQLYGTGNVETSNNGSTLGALRLESGANQTGTVTLFANSSIGVNASAATISGVIGESGGSFGFIKGGNSTLTLSGANTFSGTTTHAASTGTLQLANSLALQNSTLSYTGAAALVFDSSVGTHAFTLGGLTGTSGIALADNASNAVALTVGNNNTSPAAYSGSLSGAGSLTKIGTGAQTLSGSSTYTGATTVNAGTLLVSGSGSINSSSGITIDGSTAKFVQTSSTASTPTVTLTQGTVDGTGTLGTVNVASLAGNTIANGNGGTGTLTIGTLTFSGLGTININEANTTKGLALTTFTTANDGGGKITINATNSSAWASGTTYDLITFTTLTGGLTDFTKGTITGISGRQNAALGLSATAVTLTVSGDNPVWTGVGSQTWTTAPTNDNTGPNAWALKAGHTATNFWVNDAVEFNDTYDLGSGPTAVTNSTVTITGGVAPVSTTFNNSSVNYTVNSSDSTGITAGTLIKEGTGSVTISTANTYSGGTTLNGGTLNVNNASAIGTGSLTIAAGTTIDNTSGSAITLSTNNAQFWNGDFTFGGTNDLNLGTGAVTLASSLHLTTNGTAALTVGGVISGPSGAGLFKEGTGTLVLNGVNTFDGGVTIDAGTVRIGNASALGTSANPLTFGSSSNGKLQVNGNALALSALNGDNTTTIENSNATNGSLTVGSGSFDGILQNGSAGTLALTKTGAGTLALTGANTYSGGTTLNGGTLSVSGNSALGAGTVNMAGGTTISTSADATLSNAFTFNGGITTFSAAGGAMVLNGNVTGSAAAWMLNPTNKITLAGTNSLTSSGGFNTTAGSVDITGSTTIDGGANNNAGFATIGNQASTTLTILNGGSLTVKGTTGTKPGTIVGQNANSASILNVGAADKSSSGTLNIGGNTAFILGNNNVTASGTLNVNSGTATITAGSTTLQDQLNYIAMGRDDGTGIINLNGGTLATGRQFIRDGGTAGTQGGGTAIFNFNGGVLQAQADQTQGNGWFETATTGNFQVVTTNVAEGGAIIDTNGFNVNINTALVHAGSNTIDGGLVKNGAGTLSLGGTNTFTGNAVVTAGMLSLATNVSLDDTIVLSLVTGTTLDLGFGSGSETVFGLVLNGTAVAAGTYDATQLHNLDSSITFTSAGGTLTVLSAVPEPGTVTLISLGLICGLLVFRRRARTDSLS
jgi:autotransporter-associated beta strand protein